MWVRLPLPAPLYCGIAQLVARLFHRQNVAGSSPVPATICRCVGIGSRGRLKNVRSTERRGSSPRIGTKCDCGGIGRRSGFKIRWEIPVRVRASPVAPSIYGGSKAVMRHPLKMRADKFTDGNLNSKKICHDDNRWFDSSPPYHRDTHSKLTGFDF